MRTVSVWVLFHVVACSAEPAVPPGATRANDGVRRPRPVAHGPDPERTIGFPTRSDERVRLHVGFCEPDRGRIDVAMGSTTFRVLGKQGDDCIIEYGGEVENPRWDGVLDTTCAIPISEGTIILQRAHMGVETGPIDPYCKPK